MIAISSDLERFHVLNLTSSAIFGSQFWRPSLRWSLRPLRVLLLNGMRLR